MCTGSEAGSYLRRIDSCVTQLKAQGPSRTCNESKEEEEESLEETDQLSVFGPHPSSAATPLEQRLEETTSQKCEAVPKRARI